MENDKTAKKFYENASPDHRTELNVFTFAGRFGIIGNFVEKLRTK